VGYFEQKALLGLAGNFRQIHALLRLRATFRCAEHGKPQHATGRVYIQRYSVVYRFFFCRWGLIFCGCVFLNEDLPFPHLDFWTVDASNDLRQTIGSLA